jgi:uncharacterized protein
MPEIITGGPGFVFKPYDYGPFDADVYAEVETLQRAGDASIASSGYGRWNTYAATDSGIARGEAILRSISGESRVFLQSISDWVRAQSFRSLVKSIYDAYPEMEANSVFRR